MTKFVGKILPGMGATALSLYGLAQGDLGITNTLLLGFMGLWGGSTFYYPLLDGIEEFRDHVHNIAAKKLGVEP